MKRITSFLLIFMLLCAPSLPLLAAESADFSNEIVGEIDSGVRFDGQDTLAVAWFVKPNKPGFTLTNTQGIRLAYDNTVLRLIKWNGDSAFTDSSVGLSFSLMSGASHIQDFDTDTTQVYAAKDSSGSTGFLSLAAGDDATFHTATESMSLMGIRFAFRAGKSASDLAPGSIRLMNAAELSATSQYCGALINAYANGNPDTFISYEYLKQNGGIAIGGDTLEAPVVKYPGSEGALALSDPTQSRSSDTSATIGFSTSASGTAYYLALDSGSTAPTANTVVTGGASWSVAAGTVSKEIAITSGAKDVYVVVKGVSGNISNILKFEIPTYVDDRLTFTVGSETARSGGHVSIPIMITNNTGVSSATIRITIGPDLEWDYNPASYGNNAATWPFVVGGILPITGRPQGNNLTATSMILNFSDISSGENVYENGTLVTLKLKVKDSADEGDNPVSVTVNRVINEAEMSVPFGVVDGNVSVHNVIYGDVNGDAEIDIADLQRLAQWLNGWNVSINTSNADVNADGEVDIIDLQRLAQWLNGWNVVLGPNVVQTVSLAAYAIGITAANDDVFSFTVDSVSAETGGKISVPIRIVNNPGFSSATIKITIDSKLAWDYNSANYTNNASTWPFVVGSVLPVTGRPQGANLTATSMVLNFSDITAGENAYDNDTLVTLKLQVAEDAVGSLPITLEVTKCIDENESIKQVMPISGMVNLSASVTVTFNADNGTENTVVIVNPGDKVVKPEDPMKDGYDFIAWFDGDTEFDFDTPIISDLSLTAKWKSKPKRGDIDGDGTPTMGDMIILIDYLSGIRTFTPEEMLAADIDGDGVPTMGDLIILIDYLSGVRAEL